MEGDCHIPDLRQEYGNDFLLIAFLVKERSQQILF
jgi:hypothetical protein